LIILKQKLLLPKQDLLRHPAMKLLLRCIRRESSLQLLLALLPVLVGAALFVCCRHLGTWVSILSLGMWLIGLLLIRKALQQPSGESHPLWHTLLNNPLRIVWVYSVRTQVMPFGFYLWETGQMYFKLVDGQEICLFVPARKLRMVSRFLNKVLPHATFGYSPENEQLFRENPLQLIKNHSSLT